MADCINHPGKAGAGTCEGCGLTFCGDCLLTTPDGRRFCRSCATTGAGLNKRQDPGGLAIASLVLSAVGFMFCITAIPGMVLGFVELNNIKKGRSPAEGRGLALAGAIIGAVITAFIVLGIVLFIIMALVVGVSEA